MEKVARRRKKRQLVRHYSIPTEKGYDGVESFDFRAKAHRHDDSDYDNQHHREDKHRRIHNRHDELD